MNMPSFVTSVAVLLALGACTSTKSTLAKTGTYTGCVRQLDANAGTNSLQVILNKSDQDQLVVTTSEPALQAAFYTAFVQGREVVVTHHDASPKVVISAVLSKQAPPCQLTPQPPSSEKLYCVDSLRIEQESLLVSVSESPKSRLITWNVDDPVLQSLLEVAFLWQQRVMIGQTNNVVTRVRLDRFDTGACN